MTSRDAVARTRHHVSRAECRREGRACRLHPEPVGERAAPGAVLRSRVRARLCRRDRRGRRDHGAPLGGRGRQPRARLRGRAVGVSCRDHRRAPLLPGDELERSPAALVGAVRRVERRPGHMGRHRRRHARGAMGAASPGREHPAVPGRRRPRATRRSSDRPGWQLLQPRAVRRPHNAAVGS